MSLWMLDAEQEGGTARWTHRVPWTAISQPAYNYVEHEVNHTPPDQVRSAVAWHIFAPG